MVCGVSFQRSPVDVRERVAISSEKLPEALQWLSEQPGVHECMVLSTCNRTEMYLSVDEWVDGKGLFIRFARTLRGFDLSSLSSQIYVFHASEAISHLFRVASGLESLVLGEPQILGQTKAAFRAAENQGCVDRVLHRWVPRAFAAAKQVRNGTGICEAAVSVSYAAVQLARKIFEGLSGRSVLLLGAGKTGELAALHLHEAGASPIVVANRTMSRAEEVAGKCCGKAVEFERRAEHIAKADVVICAMEAPHYVLDEEIISRRSTSRRPLLILDISMPRNVDPRVSGLDNVYLFNIDDLENVVQANIKGRQAEAVRAGFILQNVLERFLREENSASVAPAISAIRNRVRSICQAELQKLGQRFPDMTAEQREELEVMLHRISQKVVHPAIMELKTMQDSKAGERGHTFIERLFGVEREASVC
ncbi:MAG TPA: glutamyl-tRNA reductase [Acidobacteriota bacterium]|nr:glutamyl-tRNA reductase [Acidobacteriota bacterium]